MCAPRDQRKSSNTQAEQAELNGLRFHRVADISEDVIALGKRSAAKPARGQIAEWAFMERPLQSTPALAGANLGSLRSLANARFETDLCSGLKGCDDGLCRGGEFSARTFAAGRLTADAGAFQEKGEGVGQHFRLGDAGAAAERSETIAVLGLQFFDDAASRVIVRG